MIFNPYRIQNTAIILLSFLLFLVIHPETASGSVISFEQSSPDSIQKGSQLVNDSLYRQYIIKAEAFVKKKDYQNALSEYQNAKRVKPSDQYSSLQITKMNNLLKTAASSNEEYQKRIASADKYYAAQDYLNAKASYQLALDVKPDDLYAKGKLAECMDRIRSMKASNILYDVAIAGGDKFMQAKDYVKAKEQYENAARILPEDKIAKDRINQVIKIVVDEQSREENYANAIKAADNFYKVKRWQNALIEYKNALVQKPSEKYPQDKIAELTDIIAKQKNAEENYKKAIAAADQLFNAKSYENARPRYEEAASIKPEEKYPVQKISEIDGILASLKKADDDYDRFISMADSFYVDKKYLNAKAGYQQALKVKPQESYPKEMISKADGLLAKQQMDEKSLQEAYTTAIASADKAFNDKDYENARSGYETASGIKPAESYPKSRITEIDNILAALEKQKQAEAAALAARQKAVADSLANAEKLRLAQEEALAKKKQQEAEALALRQKQIADSTDAAQKAAAAALAHRQQREADSVARVKKAAAEALALKQKHEADSLAAAKKAADEALALRQKQITDSIAAAKEAYAQRQKFISDSIAQKKAADLASAQRQKFIADSTSAAKKAQAEAFALRQKQIADSTQAAEKAAKEALALQQKREADSIASAKKAAAEALALRQKREADSIASAKKAAEDALALRKQQVADSLAAVKKAQDEAIAARKKAVSDSLSLVAKAEAERIKLAEEAKEKEYRGILSRGDSLLAATSYQQAKDVYNSALKLRPNDNYPKQKINEIDKAVADLAATKALDDKYKTAVANADRLYTAKTYDQAKGAYQNALSIKPSEQYPKDRIASIDSIFADIAKTKQLNDQYKAAITKADQLFNGSSMVQAREAYTAAAALKPSEIYPASKIAAIDKALADQKAVDDSYNAAIANADKLMNEKSYDAAKAAYLEASKIKAGEKYPKDQIAQIDKTNAEIARQKTVDDKYNASIAKADKLFADKNYPLAKTEFGNALSIKPGESYPKERISEIDGIVAEMKAKDDAYTASVTKANGLLAAKSYEEARTEYQHAAEIKPDEQFPKTKITEINNLLTELKGKRQTFDDLIASADKAFGEKDLKKAKEGYRQSLEIFPDEAYPKQKIARITAINDSIYRANKVYYDKAIADGDKAFNSLIFDKAIDAYTEASSYLPDENYPRDMIAKIKKTISENAMVDVVTTTTIIKAGAETKFPFPAVNIGNRKNNYVYIKIRNLSDKSFNVLLRYGKDNQISGGAVIRNLESGDQVRDRLISFRDQDPWYRVDNNYISLYPQGGDVEVTFIQISRAAQ